MRQLKDLFLTEELAIHTLAVPGPDGKLGFGGSCFPKDIQALIKFGEANNVDMNVLKGAWKTNLTVRPEKDWEQLKGRAVSNEKKKIISTILGDFK